MSKRFVSDLLPEVVQESAFQAAWPQFQPKAYSSSVSSYLREIEERILKQAKGRALEVEKEAYEKGYAQGEKDGQEMGQKRIDTVIHHFKMILQEMNQQQNSLHQFYEKEMLQLAICISKKIVRHELTVQEEVIQTILRESIREMADQKKMIIHLHPADYQYLLSHSESYPLTTDEGGNVRLVEDRSISRGGCFIESSFGETDATLEGQFDEIVTKIWEQWEQKLLKNNPTTP